MENEGAFGVNARAKKYSMLSSNPVKLPRGETRPEALAEKRPLGTAEPPWVIIGTLSVGVWLVRCVRKVWEV